MSAVEGAASAAAKGAAAGAKGLYKCANIFCGCLSRQIKKLSVRTVTILLRIFNFANSILMAITCFMAFRDLVSACYPTCVTRTFLAVYMGVFSIMLFSFEARFKYTEPFIRRLFGFMFTSTGRAVFLIFIGAICFGMIDSSQSTKDTDGYKWCVGVGVGTLANSFFNFFIICSHPGFQAANRTAEVEAGGPPAGGDPSQLTDAQIKAYLEAHPELAQQALSSAKATTTFSGDVESGAGTGAVAEWNAPSAGASKAPSGGNAGGFFGFGKKKGGAAAAPEASGATAYAPPSFSGSATSSAAVPSSKASAPPTAPADDEDNPFAAPGGPRF